MSRREVPILVAIVLIMAAVSLAEPRFLTAANFQSILLWVPLLTVCAMGQMAVMLTRGIDVSVGSTLGLAGMGVALLLRDHPGLPVSAAMLLGIAFGAALGAVNGALIALARIPAIVATLGTLGIWRGLTFFVSQGKQVDDYQLPRALARFSSEGPLGQSVAPWVTFLALAAAVATHLFLTRTRAGRDLYALGGNPDAAAMRGLPIRARTFLVYVLCGAGAGLAGVLYASRFGTVNPATIGEGFELLVIAACVIGGVSVFGGVGSVPGVVLGCLLLGVINVALAVLAVADTWQRAVYGLVILIAVLGDDLAARRLRLRLTGEEEASS